MEKKIAKYVELVKALKACGEDILESCTLKDREKLVREISEVENMDLHLVCCAQEFGVELEVWGDDWDDDEEDDWDDDEEEED